MESEYSSEEDYFNYFDAFAKELNAESDGKQADWQKEEKSLMHYFTLAEQDLMNDLDIGELEQERSLKIESLFSSNPPGINKVFKVVDHQIGKNKYVRALILIKWANDYGDFDSDTNASSYRRNCMSRLISKAYNIIRKKISKTDVKLLAIAKKYGEPLMVEMYEKMKKIQLWDDGEKVKHDAISCQLITSVRGLLEMSEEAIESGEECIAMLEKQFGENAKKYRTFGHALTVIGLAYKQLGKYESGNEKLQEAIEAMRLAKDFINEIQRLGYIQYAQRLLYAYDSHDDMMNFYP